MPRDNKQTKSIGEFHVASELARRGWAPALTRDGLERTDVLAVRVDGGDRRLVEIQVKTNSGAQSWPINPEKTGAPRSEREYFVFVHVPDDPALAPRSFVVPTLHVTPAAWIAHMDWLTEPGVAAGKRNAPVSRTRLYEFVIAAYEDRWDLLHQDARKAKVLLPSHFRDLVNDPRIEFPVDHPWAKSLPRW